MFPIIYSANGLRVPLSCAASGTLSRDNAFRSDWLAERGGLETAVSREDLPTENGAAVGEIFRVKIRQHPPESEFAFSSVGVPSLNLEFRCHEIPSDELNSSKGSGSRDRFTSSDGH